MVDRARWVGIAAFACASALLLYSAPTNYDAWWSDAPRHALNGAFVLDFVREWPWRDPYGWAVDYYLRYPALTILFYPPLFYVFEAGAFALFGVSHFSAQLTVAAFVFVLAIGVSALARFYVSSGAAIAVGLLVIGLPEVTFWSRQVMLDVPALALVAVSGYFFLRFLDGDRQRDALLAAVFAVAAIATKQTSAVVLPVFLLVGLFSRGVSFLRHRAVVRAAVVVCVGLAPIVWLAFVFGAANLESVAGRSSDPFRWSAESLTFYVRQLPAQMGWPAILLAAAGVALLVRRVWTGQPPERTRAVFLLVWLVVAYVFFSFVGLKGPRHNLVMLLPLAIGAVLALQKVLPGRGGLAAAIVLAVGTFCYSLVFRPVPRISGYDRVADYVAAHAPQDAIVLFHGQQDGNFMLHLRAHAKRGDTKVLRTDKLLLRVVAGELTRGVQQADYTAAEIESLVKDLGADLIIAQPGFWSELEQMRRFESAIKPPMYAQVARFAIVATHGDQAHMVDILRPTYPVERRPREFQMEMPLIGGRFRGNTGDR